MRKDLGRKIILAPLPVMVIGTYDENDVPDAMIVAWGGQCSHNHVCLALSQHQTTENIRQKKAFTLSVADRKNMIIADYFGIVSGKNENKIAKAGVHVHKSNFVDAPLIEEFPLTLECKVVSINEEFGETRVVGEIVNLSVDEVILDGDGRIDLDRLKPISYDPAVNAYRILGEKMGFAFKDGFSISKNC